MKKGMLATLLCLMMIGQAGAQIFYNDQVEERPIAPPQRYLYCGTADNPIRVVSFMSYPPFGWKETQLVQDVFQDRYIHRYYGMGIDLFRQFSSDYKLAVTFTNILNYQEARYALAQGYFDVLVTDYYDGETYKNIGFFHPGYVVNPIVIVSLKENTDKMEDLKDLIGKKGYIRKEEGFYDLYRKSIPDGVTITHMTGAKKAFFDLIQKKIDFILMSRYAYETEIRRFKIEDYVKHSAQPVFSPYIFMSYAKNNQCALFIKNALERSLKESTADSNNIKALIVKQLNTWQSKFSKEKSLMFEAAIEEEKEEKAGDIDKWLKEQQAAQDANKAKK